MKQRTLFGFIAIILTLGLYSCLEDAQYPDEPTICFLSLETAGQGGTMTIGFTDGDGNIGLAQSDTLAPFCPDTCTYYYNLFWSITNFKTVYGPTSRLTPSWDKFRFITA